MHHRSPAIQYLQIHLFNEQIMTFNNDTNIIAFLQNKYTHKIFLTEFFITNKKTIKTAANDERLDFDCRQLLYQEFSMHMIWNTIKRRWKWRKMNKTIEWIYFVDSSDDERFYLHILFTIVKSSMSFEDLCIYDDMIHEIFKSICIARDLLDSDEQWDCFLMKVELWQDEYQLRQLFVYILLYCYSIDAFQLWLKHAQHLSDDCHYQL